MTETKMSAIDRALAAAKARKAAKEAAGITEEAPVAKPAKEPKAAKEKPVKAPKAPKAAKEPKAKVVDEAKEAAKAERAAAKAAKMAELEAARAARKAERDAKKAEREAAKANKASTGAAAAHMKKVEKARAKLPTLSSEAELVYNEIISNFGGPAVVAIAEHLKLYVRMSATQRATTGAALEPGSTVRIVGGDPKFINMVGTVVKSQKLRSFVKVPGVRKDVYVFTTDLKVVEDQPMAMAV